MIVYFADRHMNILGVASDLLPGAFHLRDDMKTSEIESGLSTFEVTIDYKKENHITLKKYAAAGNFLLVREKDNTYIPYTIIDREDDIADRHVYVYAEDAGLDLLNEIVPAYEAVSAATARDYILAFTADSGFEIGIDEIGTSVTKTLHWDGEETAASRVRSVALEFDNAEIGYSFTIDKFRITHKYIDIYKKHGKDVALELRFGREIDDIVERESVANLVTALRCHGGTPESTDAHPEPVPITFEHDGYGPHVYHYDDGDIYTDGFYLKSREYNKKWTRYLTESGTGEGYIVGAFSYDTTSQKELCDQAIAELKRLREPEITYEVSLNTLPENLKLGDTCRIIDDNGELYVSARLIELKVSECNNAREATFGDFKKLTSGINDKVEKLAEEFAKIQAAKTLYTWMVFADDASGTNMSTSSVGKSYIGIATNKISPDPDLTNPLLYTFTRISAVDGRGFTVRGSWAPNTSYSITGTNIDVVEHEGSTYACNNSHVSGQTFDPSKWVLIAEKGTDGEDGYSPTATVTKSGDTTTITITDKNGTTTQTVLDGEDGHSPTITTTKSGTTTTILADGVSIGTVIDGDDGHSPSVTATKTDGVTTVKVDGTTIATINDGSSVIIQSATKVGDTTTVILKDGSGTKTLTIKDGEDGDNGQPGSNGDDAYVHIAWATSADGSEGFSTSVSEGKTYMGSYSDHTLADSQTPSDYNWSLIKGEDGYSPTAKVTKSGSTATITITDKNGTTTETVSDGTSATSYSLIVSHAAVVKAAGNNSYTPSSIDLSSKSQTGSGAFGNYAGRFKIETYNGTSWTARYTSSTNESSHSYTIPTNIDGIKAIRCSLYLAGGTTTLIDQQIVPIVSDGTNGTSVSITAREYVESSSGTTTPSSGWSTTIPSVAEGKYLWTRISYSDGSYSYSVAKQGVSGQNGQSITVTETKYTEGTSATTAPTSGWGTSIPSVAEGNYLWTRVTYSDTTVTYSVAKQGLSGSDGEDAYTVVLTNENYTFVGSETAAIASNTSTGLNVAECNVIAYKGATQIAAHIGTISGKPTTGMTTSISSNDSTSAKFTVTVSTSMATKNGVLTIPVYIDPASSSGKLFNMKFTYSLAIKGVDGRAITGVTNYYLATSASSGVTRSTSGWTTSVQSMTSTNQYLWNYEKLTYSSGTTTTYTDPVIIGRYGQDGQSGSAGKGITGITEYYQKSSSNSQAPTTWVTTPPKTTTSEPYLWNYEVITYTTGDSFTSEKRVIGTHGATGATGANGVSITGVTNYYLATSASSGVTKSTSGWTTTIQTIDATKQYLWNYEVVSYSSGSPTETSPMIIGRFGKDGANGTTGADGKGITAITEYYQVNNDSSNPPGGTWQTTPPTTSISNPYLWNYEVITYTTGDPYESPKRIIGTHGATGATGESGDDGYNQATIYLYRRSATTISTKPGAATYTFSTGSLTSVSNWTRTIPADDGTPCYVSSVSVKSRTNTASIAQADWSSPILLITSSTKWYSGTAITGTSSTAAVYSTGITYANVGDHYINTSTQNVYRCTVAGNASTAKWVYEQNIQGPRGVTGISGTSSYFHVKYSNDGGSTFTGNSGEDPGDYIGTYTDDNATDSTSVSSYTWVRVTGLNQATIYLYKRSATAVSTKPVGATYTFSTGALTSVSGWSRSIPASDGNPCYVSSVSVSSTASSVTINQNDWSTPIKLVEDGAKGETGATGATGATGETGAQGLSLRGVLIRNRWTDSQWNTTYGIGYTGNFSNYDILSSSTGTNGKLPISTWNVGDLYQLTGTSTDTGKAYIATLRYTEKRTSDTTSIPSEVIALSYAEKGTDGEDGNGIVSKTDYYLLSDTMVSTDLSTAKSHVPHDLSGSIVTMTDAMGDIPFENVVANILPIQSGSGDPSPTNIRPISGWTGVTVQRTGRNLFNYDPNKVTTGTTTGGATRAYYPLGFSNCTLSFSAELINSDRVTTTHINIGKLKDGRLTVLNSFITPSGITERTFTFSEDEQACLMSGESSVSITLNFPRYRICVITGTTPTVYEPYNGASYPVTWSEAGTVYGGTLDVVRGTLTVTMAIVDLGTLTWAKSGSIPSHFYAPSTASNIPYKYSNSCYMICSNYKYDGPGNTTPTVGGYYGQNGTFRYYYASTASTAREIYISDEAKASLTATEFKTAMSGVQLVYELAEPVTYQLKPAEINSLAGLNNVWADTGDISLTYFDEHDATWQTTPVDPNQYSRYQWWYYNTTYTDGRSIDSDPAIICVYNQDWYDDTQKAIADAKSASQTANDAAKAAEANAGALRNISDIVNGTENTTGLVDQINSISNTMATASSVEELREEKNQDLERLISNYSLSDFLNWFHFDQNQGLIIGKTTTTGSANYVLRLEGDIISFYELTGNVSDLNDQQRVGYFQNRNLMSENIVALSTFDLGNFRFMKQDSGNLSFVYTG